MRSRSNTPSKASPGSSLPRPRRFATRRPSWPRSSPRGARFSLTRDYPAEIERVGVIEPARWLAWASGVDTLNAFNPESSQAGAVAYTADAPNPGESIDDWVRALRRLGVADVVVDKPVIEARMVNRPLVQEVWKEGPVAIFQINADSGARPPILLDSDSDGLDTTVRFSEAGAENLRWSVQSPRDFVATIAVAWSPKWHASVDGTGRARWSRPTTASCR